MFSLLNESKLGKYLLKFYINNYFLNLVLAH